MERERRKCTDEFKQKIVELNLGGKRQATLSREYDLTLSAVNGWVKRFNNSGSFKASSADYGAKVNLVLSNKDKYSNSAMGKALKISRATVYYREEPRLIDEGIVEAIKDISRASKNNYGTRKNKVELEKRDIIVSRCRIGHIIAENGLVFNYTVSSSKFNNQQPQFVATPGNSRNSLPKRQFRVNLVRELGCETLS